MRGQLRALRPGSPRDPVSPGSPKRRGGSRHAARRRHEPRIGGRRPETNPRSRAAHPFRSTVLVEAGWTGSDAPMILALPYEGRRCPRKRGRGRFETPRKRAGRALVWIRYRLRRLSEPIACSRALRPASTPGTNEFERELCVASICGPGTIPRRRSAPDRAGSQDPQPPARRSSQTRHAGSLRACGRPFRSDGGRRRGRTRAGPSASALLRGGPLCTRRPRMDRRPPRRRRRVGRTSMPATEAAARGRPPAAALPRIDESRRRLTSRADTFCARPLPTPELEDPSRTARAVFGHASLAIAGQLRGGIGRTAGPSFEALAGRKSRICAVSAADARSSAVRSLVRARRGRSACGHRGAR
jgi:hypothetical protein